MTAEVVARGRVPVQPSGGPFALWLAVAAGAGLAVGVAASISLLAAIGVAATVTLLVWLLPRPAGILIVLMASVFVQVLTVSGVAISRIFGPVALLLVVVAVLRGQAALRTSAPLGWAAAYGAWAVASGLWSVHLDGTTTQLGSLAIASSYMLAFATLLESRREMNRVLYTLAVMALAVGIFGIASQGRGGENTGDPNFFAMVEIVALPLVLVLAATAPARWLRLSLYAVVPIIVTSVFWSLSRGGLIALGAVALGILALPARAIFRSPAQKAVVLLVLAAAVIGAFRLTAPALSERVTSVFTAQGETGSGRLNAWRAAYTSIQERPFLGLGYGSFLPSANELMLRTPGVDLSNQRLRARGLYAHSAYIETLAELGVVGLALFLGLLASTARALGRTAARASEARATFTRRISHALLLSLIGWAAAAFFLSSQTSRSFWIIIGITLALPKLLDEEVARRGAISSAL
jgi:O-antigen ligase